MNFLLKDPNCKLTAASNIIVMIRRKWPSGFLRTAKIGVLVFAVCILDRSSEQREPVVRQEENKESKESTVILPLYIEIGQASWYGPGFQGQETASGETFDAKR